MYLIGVNDSIIIEEFMTLFVYPQVENNYTKELCIIILYLLGTYWFRSLRLLDFLEVI